MMIRIRKLQETEVAKAARLIKTTLLKTNAQYYPKKVIKNLITDYSAKNLKNKMKTRTFFVATKTNQIVGVIALTSDGWIGAMFVHPQYQEQGIGSKLVKKVISTAKLQGLDVIRSNISLNSVGFYKKLGFKLIKNCCVA